MGISRCSGHLVSGGLPLEQGRLIVHRIGNWNLIAFDLVEALWQLRLQWHHSET